MRGAERALAALCCAALLSGCGGGSGGRGPAHPAGWIAHGQGAGASFTSPQHSDQRYSVTSSANANATLGDMASQITMNTLLRYRGARLVKAEPFPSCPGEAGRQTFRRVTPHGQALLQVAFTQWSGKAVIASYERPASAPDDPAALEAMRASVCSSPLGG